MSCGCGKTRTNLARYITGSAMLLIRDSGRRGVWYNASEILGMTDRRGLVRWCGVQWYGVPKPLRWWYGDRLGRWLHLPGPPNLPGCGCIRQLKVRLRLMKRAWKRGRGGRLTR